MPSSLLGAHPAAASGGETPDETKPDKEGWDKPGDEALSFKDRTTLRYTITFVGCVQTKSAARCSVRGHAYSSFLLWSHPVRRRAEVTPHAFTRPETTPQLERYIFAACAA